MRAGGNRAANLDSGRVDGSPAGSRPGGPVTCADTPMTMECQDITGGTCDPYHPNTAAAPNSSTRFA